MRLTALVPLPAVVVDLVAFARCCFRRSNRLDESRFCFRTDTKDSEPISKQKVWSWSCELQKAVEADYRFVIRWWYRIREKDIEWSKRIHREKIEGSHITDKRIIIREEQPGVADRRLILFPRAHVPWQRPRRNRCICSFSF